MTDRKKEPTDDDAASAAVTERRIVPRTPVDAPAVFKVLSETGSAEDGRLLDLSIAGAAFRASRELPLGAVVRLGIPAADASGPPSQIKGTIVNRRELDDGHWRYGLKFDKLYYTLAKRAIELAIDPSIPNPEASASSNPQPTA